MSRSQARLLIPQIGEQVEIFSKGELTAKGTVTQKSETQISLLSRYCLTIHLGIQSLLEGIRNGTITVRRI